MSGERFEPELGQAAFSNTPWHEIEMHEAVYDVLRVIGEFLVLEHQTDQNPCDNCGGDGQFENDTFAMRAYCWCDGGIGYEDHEDGCPPNFHFKPTDFKCAWYKHAGRGATQNRKVTPPELYRVLIDCLGSFATPEDPRITRLREIERGSE